jgi:hypothetical protein
MKGVLYSLRGDNAPDFWQYPVCPSTSPGERPSVQASVFACVAFVCKRNRLFRRILRRIGVNHVERQVAPVG